MKKQSLILAICVAAVFCLSSCAEKSGLTSDIMSEKAYTEASQKYSNVSLSMTEGVAIVRSKDSDLYGFINHKGKEIIACNYSSAAYFQEGMSAVSKKDGENEMYGFINKKGAEVVPFKYNAAHGFTEDELALVALSDGSKLKYGYVNKKGEEVVGCIYEDANDFSEGYACVKDDSGKWGFIDKKGNIVISPDYDMAGDFSEGLACVVKDLETESPVYEFINKKGETEFRLSLGLSTISEFHEGMCVVKDNNKEIEVKSFWTRGETTKEHPYGFVNKKGEVVIKCQYSYAEDFEEGKAYVKDENGDSSYINKKGEEVEK